MAKLCNNMALGVIMAVTGEALALGVSQGLDPARLSQMIAVSTGRSWATEVCNPWPGVLDNAPSSRGYSGGFGNDLMLKDLGLAVDAAMSAGATVPLGELARNLYSLNQRAGRGGLDFSSVIQLFTADIELLQQQFQLSIETVCHRLSTLQRPHARGVPFYFVRLDQAGNISKRQSATSFHFARHGGACPLWHVHEAFAQPGRILTQVAEMPDGIRYFGIARTIERGGGGFRARRKLFAVGLGCELSHARELVYADHIDIDHPSDVAPIGPGCRVCPRQDCVQRAFPPAGKSIVIDSNTESLVSYRFATD